MTDGIIQEVFRNWELKDTPENQFYQDVQDSIKQELVKRIKEEFPIEHPFNHVYGTPRIQQKLIGDYEL